MGMSPVVACTNRAQLTGPRGQTVENAASLHVDPSKGFLVGGDSSGGNIATVLAHLARDDPFFKDRPITGQVIREALIIHPDVYPEE